MDPILFEHFLKVEDRHWWFQARKDLIVGLLERTLPGLKQNGRPSILEVGAGTGLISEAMTSLGDVHALEAQPIALRRLASRPGVTVHEGLLPSPALEEASFDVTCACDVLEHIDDDLGVLRDMVRLTRTGGLVLLTVPAMPMLWSGHDELNEHKRRYRKKEFKRLIADAGLELEYFSGFLTVLWPAVFLQRCVLDQTIKPGTSSVGHIPREPLNRLLYKLFYIERLWLWRGWSTPFGVSYIALARRPASD